MEYTNDLIDKIYHLKEYNFLYSKYFLQMSHRYLDEDLAALGNTITQKSLVNRSFRIKDCMNYWEWDRYNKNMILDLQRVERCHDERFCPNCRTLAVSKDIMAMKNFYKDNGEKYDFYLLTLTVPNIYPDFDNFINPKNEIKFAKRFSYHVDKLYSCFKKLTEKYCSPESSKKAYHGRTCLILGGMRVLEITYSPCRSGSMFGRFGFHPHFHCLIYVKKGSLTCFDTDKTIKGKWSDTKLREFCKENDLNYDKISFDDKMQLVKGNDLYNYKSRIDSEISIVWSLIWHGLPVTDKDIDSIGYSPQERFLYMDGEETDIKALEVDLRLIEDEKGIYEAVKYTFKLKEFSGLFEFSQIVFVLQNRRLRQTFGEMYKIKLEDLLDNEKIPLILEYQEESFKLYIREMTELLDYKEYRKISRFKVDIDGDLLD